MSRTGTDPDDELVVYQAILDTLNGPRVVWRDGEPTIDLSAFDRPFAPAVTPSGTDLQARRGRPPRRV